MKAIIGVQNTLSPVKQYLSEKGFEVRNFDGHQSQEYDAIVLSGQSKNFLGMEDTATRVPVIDARGLTPEEVYNRLRESLEKK